MNMLNIDDVLEETENKEVKTKDGFTIYMMITALNVIYLIFCYTQIKSLFTIENIKYSSYAMTRIFPTNDSFINKYCYDFKSY